MSDASNGKAATVSFTDSEMKLLVSVLKYLKDGSSIDFDAEAVAQELGMKDAGSVRARWNTIKRNKIHAAAGSTSAGGVAKASPSKNKATPKKAAALDDTPKKRGRTSKAIIKAEPDDEEKSKK